MIVERLSTTQHWPVNLGHSENACAPRNHKRQHLAKHVDGCRPVVKVFVAGLLLDDARASSFLAS